MLPTLISRPDLFSFKPKKKRFFIENLNKQFMAKKSISSRGMYFSF